LPPWRANPFLAIILPPIRVVHNQGVGREDEAAASCRATVSRTCIPRSRWPSQYEGPMSGRGAPPRASASPACWAVLPTSEGVLSYPGREGVRTEKPCSANRSCDRRLSRLQWPPFRTMTVGPLPSSRYSTGPFTVLAIACDMDGCFDSERCLWRPNGLEPSCSAARATVTHYPAPWQARLASISARRPSRPRRGVGRQLP
jgi:hypothetical protein